MQLPTARALVCHLSSEWNCLRVISQTQFVHHSSEQKSHFQKSHTGQILYSGLTQPWKVTVTFVGESKKKKPVEEH